MMKQMKELLTFIPILMIALKKAQTPWYAKCLALLTIVYALYPIDIVPDFIPILGYLVGVIILPGVI